MDNFRAAWDWAVTQGEFALIEQTMRVFAALYDMRGWLQEGLEMLDHAVAALETAHGQLPPDRTTQIALGHILTTRAMLATRLGQQEQAQAMFERSLEILRPLDEPRVLVETITFLGLVMEFTGNYLQGIGTVHGRAGDRHGNWRSVVSQRCAASARGGRQSEAAAGGPRSRTSDYSPSWRIGASLAIPASQPLH